MTEERFNEIMTENGFYVENGFAYLDNINYEMVGACNCVTGGKDYDAALWKISLFKDGTIKSTVIDDDYTSEEYFEKEAKALGVKYRNLKKQIKTIEIKNAGEEYDIR